MCGGDAQLPLLWRKSLFKVWSQKDWGPCLFIFFGYASKWIFYSKRLWVRQLLSCHYRNKSPTFRCGFQPTAAVKSNGQPTKRMKTAQGLPAYLRPGAHRLIIHPWTWQINDVHCSTVELRGRARRAGRDNTSGLESSVKTKQFPQQIKYAQSVFPCNMFSVWSFFYANIISFSFITTHKQLLQKKHHETHRRLISSPSPSVLHLLLPHSSEWMSVEWHDALTRGPVPWQKTFIWSNCACSCWHSCLVVSTVTSQSEVLSSNSFWTEVPRY